MEKANGLVLKSLKYGDTSLIVHVYTKEFAMKSLLIKGFFGSKKKNLRALNFPFNYVEFNFKNKFKDKLILPQNLNFDAFSTDFSSHPVKNLLLQFLAEIAYITLKEDDPNAEQFDYIVNQLNLLKEKANEFAEFHLLFLLHLTYYQGFYPNKENAELPYFDLLNGNFTSDKTAHYRLDETVTEHWRTLLNANFSDTYKNQFSRLEREILLDNLLIYYHLHVPGFREPKSLEIIKSIINS